MLAKLKFFCMSMVCIGAVLVIAPGRAQEEDAKPIEERVVVPEDGVHKFEVTGRGTLFRLKVSVASGGEIKGPVISGKAKHLRTAEVYEVVEGGAHPIGAEVKEYVFRGTADGRVAIEFSLRSPSGDITMETFDVTVK